VRPHSPAICCSPSRSAEISSSGATRWSTARASNNATTNPGSSGPNCRNERHRLLLSAGIGSLGHRHRHRPLTGRTQPGDQDGGWVQPQLGDGEIEGAEQPFRQRGADIPGRLLVLPGAHHFRGWARRNPSGHPRERRGHPREQRGHRRGEGVDEPRGNGVLRRDGQVHQLIQPSAQAPPESASPQVCVPAADGIHPARVSVQPSNFSTMNHRDYLAQLRDDAQALTRVLASAAPDTPVRSCPGWSLNDLGDHVAAVYLHKTAALRTGEEPSPWPPELKDGIWQAPVPERLEISSTDLLAELSARDPLQHCWTWYAEDQTVGFWARRMAQETVIHRWDAQDAVGRQTPINSVVAADGIDELLVAFLSGDWSDEPQPGPFGTVDVVAGAERWRVDLQPDAVAVQHSGPDDSAAGPADALIQGGCEEMLLALWGRADQPAAWGEQGLAEALYRRLQLVSQ